MSKVIQRPLACRNAHCGAMCYPAQANLIDSPSRCPFYERRDDLYWETRVLDKIRAEIADYDDLIGHNAQVQWCLKVIDKYKAGEEQEMKVRILEDIDKEEISKAVVLLDLFTKTYCRYPNDYDRFNDLTFRCDECPFYKDNADCLVKIFKNKYAPNYRDFGSMGDL